MRRRGLLAFGAVAAMAVALPPVLRRLPTDFDFVSLPGLPGFRLLRSGAVSGGPDPFAGLGLDGRAFAQAEEFTDAGRVCAALFGPMGWTAERLPIAIFTDFNCPYCKELEAQLVALEASGAPVRLVWHDLPLLGDASLRAARAVLAARILGEEDAARAWLWTHALPPGRAGFRRMAAALVLDAEALQRLADGSQVAGMLSRSLALGSALGLAGTPGTVFGRTLVIGAITPADQERLVALERALSHDVCA
jgi:hypothetical protein